MFKDKELPSVCIFLPTSTQPRFHKRALQIFAFRDVFGYYYERGYYKQNLLPKDVLWRSMGKCKDGEYLSRLWSIIKAAYNIRRTVKKRETIVFYAMGWDCMIIARLAGMKRGVVEIGDVRSVDSRLGWMKLLERVLGMFVSAVVVTSPKFETYYRELLRRKVYIIENKVDSRLTRKREERVSRNSGKITIGIVGLLRYSRPLELLFKFIKIHSADYNIVVYGDGPCADWVKAQVCGGIQYYGSFRNPQDLAEIYQTIDVNYAVYDNDSVNVRWAIPNKFYESIFFGVPLICCNDTAVADRVMHWGVGLGVGIESDANFEKSMIGVNWDWITKKSLVCRTVETKRIVDDGERVINELLKGQFPSYI